MTFPFFGKLYNVTGVVSFYKFIRRLDFVFVSKHASSRDVRPLICSYSKCIKILKRTRSIYENNTFGTRRNSLYKRVYESRTRNEFLELYTYLYTCKDVWRAPSQNDWRFFGRENRRTSLLFFYLYLFCFRWSLFPNRHDWRDAERRQVERRIIAGGNFFFSKKTHATE